MSSSPDDVAVQVGDVLGGRYTITGTLGRGAMGTVLSARDAMTDAPVAIKVLRKDHAAHAERFVREAQATARLDSPHVVRVHGAAHLPSGEPYLVMEQLHGVDLAEHIGRHGPVEVTVLADVLVSVCLALATAHRVGIIHRDLKPANIFLARPEGGAEIVKLLDFGVAKVPEGVTLTAAENVLGSPLYMSPEQLEASPTLDARSDIWSFGIVLFEALTGTLPYRGRSLLHQALLIREKDVPSVRRLRPELPPELEAVIRRCLAKTPGERFQDVGELAEALAPFASTTGAARAATVRGVLSGLRPEPAGAARRTRLVSRFGVLAVLAVLAVLVGASFKSASTGCRAGAIPRASR